jgi:two-component system sensor histidine kinase RegB
MRATTIDAHDTLLAADAGVAPDLCRILDIRLLMLVICMAAVVFAVQALELALPLLPLTTLIGSAFALTALLRWRATRRSNPSGSHAMLVQLLLDVGLLTAILYFSGGWTNPLVSLYLVPIAVAAALLPRLATWIVAAAAALAYTAMTRFFRPVFDLHHGGDDFALHVTGMWLTFVIAGALLAYFGTRFTETLRRRDRALAEAREANLRNEQIIGVATLAAGTAHELSTPLATIAVIAAELETSAEGETGDDLAELSRQVRMCREILDRLRNAANPEASRRPSREFLAEVVERFQLLRPAVPIGAALPDAADGVLDADPVLHQALLNLLDNAANASPRGIECNGRVCDTRLEVEILDRGPGFAAAAATPGGLGMGLVLANTTIERRGGRVFATPRPNGGTCVRVTLPLARGSEATT